MNTTFATLISVYSTAEALVAYLKSPEGGRLCVRDYRAPGDAYVVIYYDKETSDMNHINTSFFRSIVWNMDTNRPACISPRHGAPFSQTLATGWTAEELVDGVMINMFYDPKLENWHIASRTQLGATGNFYGNRPFEALFHETCKVQGIDLTALPKDLCYSFVLNHPEERIVVPALYGTPTLTLVESYRIDQATGGYTKVDATFENVKKPVTFPTLETLEGVVLYVAAREAADRHSFQGVILKTATGHTKLRSKLYMHARYLRGNQAKLPFHWLHLWSSSTYVFKSYLDIYPEEEVAAQGVIENFKGCTQQFHDLYVEIYKKHTLPLGSAPQKYRKLIWEARQQNIAAYFPVLRDFMNRQDTARKLWLINYEVRYAAKEVVETAVTA